MKALTMQQRLWLIVGGFGLYIASMVIAPSYANSRAIVGQLTVAANTMGIHMTPSAAIATEQPEPAITFEPVRDPFDEAHAEFFPRDGGQASPSPRSSDAVGADLAGPGNIPGLRTPEIDPSLRDGRRGGAGPAPAAVAVCLTIGYVSEDTISYALVHEGSAKRSVTIGDPLAGSVVRRIRFGEIDLADGRKLIEAAAGCGGESNSNGQQRTTDALAPRPIASAQVTPSPVAPTPTPAASPSTSPTESPTPEATFQP